jgi:peptidoglycan/xylan/chitin deacetylase (PgdA/CDA1 family)
MRKTITNLARRVSRSRGAGHGVVLMYHRIAPADVAGGGVAVAAHRFEEHLLALRSSFRLLPLSALVRSRADGAIPRRSVAITFDDGYLDNLTEAKPLLERYDAPATVFVVSGYVGSGRRFWWDELERICVSPRTLPARLELAARGMTRTWSIDSGSDRRPLFRELRELLGPLDEDEREEALAQLRSWADVTPAPAEIETLTPHQLRRLADGGIVDIGAHTVTHPRLTGLPRHRQLEEIRSSVEQLERILDRPVTLFSYPFGAHDRTTVACAKDAGLVCACTTFAGGVERSTDPHRLPRIYVGDWPADELVAQVSERLL